MPPPSSYGLEFSNPCATRKCQNGGICQAVNKDGDKSLLPSWSLSTKRQLQKPYYQRKKYHAKCICPKQYAGLLCEKQNLCLDRCMNGGTCEWSKENIVTCNCKEGFAGERCEAKVNNDLIVKFKHPNHGHHPSGIDADDIDDTEAVNRGVTTILSAIITTIILFVIIIGITMRCRTQRLGHAFRHRRMAENLLTGQPSASRDVPIGEFPNQMFLEDDQDDMEEESRSRSIVRNRGHFRLRSQHSKSSNPSANFVNPVYENVFGEGEDNNSKTNSCLLEAESSKLPTHQNEDNENSSLLIHPSSNENEKDAMLHKKDCMHSDPPVSLLVA